VALSARSLIEVYPPTPPILRGIQVKANDLIWRNV
jgi:hypothetical protein